METLTIKLLHERRNRNPRRKVDGYSGKLYVFLWSDEHDGYCFTTSKQEEADDLFKSQGRTMGSYFAPMITIKAPEAPKPISPKLEAMLSERGLALPDVGVGIDSERIALAVLEGWEKGFAAAMPAPGPAPATAPEEAPSLVEPSPKKRKEKAPAAN